MTDSPAFFSGVAVMLALALSGAWRFVDVRPQLLRVAAVLTANWVACWLYVRATGDYTPWMFNIAVDAVSAAFVLWHPAGRVQGYIGLFYSLQIAWHVAFGFRGLIGLAADPGYYYDWITGLAWAQLLAMGAWSGGLWIAHFVHRWRRVRNPADLGAAARNEGASR